ncbi:hypothetical protein E1B28_002030 [Marasmius oreades]|uniref:Uncharacterized protein n=1 Tax=Marasmius oreades TaxID=181124 RepID=A0A9P8AG24_9AGAR|nr:uncharacterized protein E1B28_002030 [Marasmius oreades]KAG7100257.1 hypothetical protein E1B28_002030 [Marasmius oreades]
MSSNYTTISPHLLPSFSDPQTSTHHILDDSSGYHSSSCTIFPMSFKSLSLKRRPSLRSLIWRRSSTPLILDPLDETRPGRPLPNLPPELWVMIIRYSAGSFGYGHGENSVQDQASASNSVFTAGPTTNIPLLTRVEYITSISQKISCSLVSKRWNAYTAEVLYEYIWLSRSRQAKALALTLLCQVCASPIVHPSIYSTASSTSNYSNYTHYPTPSNSKTKSASTSSQCGRHIRVLHLETPMLDRCNPLDIRVILDYAPNLIAYCDFKSLRRNLVEEVRDPRGSAEGLLKALGAGRKCDEPSLLKRLTWTCYSMDSISISSFALNSVTANLEYCEMDFSGLESSMSSLFGGAFTGTSSTVDVDVDVGVGVTTTMTMTSEAFITSTTTTVSSSSSEEEKCADAEELGKREGGMVVPGVVFPCLKGLKITLPESTFHLLSSWQMPQLENLSVSLTDSPNPVVSSDGAFHQFFKVHGKKLLQLELSSSFQGEEGFSLRELCPNLRSFVCSCVPSMQVDWNWEDPDWVAPHALLTSHENLQFIGVRGLGEVVRRAWEESAPSPGSPEYIQYLFSSDPSPFFMLLEQVTSLLRTEAFPNLKYIRDLSEESDWMRRGWIPLADYPPRPPTPPTPRSSKRARGEVECEVGLGPGPVPGHARVVSYWKEVLERTRERGVYVEDLRGVNITRRDLERWGAGME